MYKHLYVQSTYMKQYSSVILENKTARETQLSELPEEQISVICQENVILRKMEFSRKRKEIATAFWSVTRF